MSLSTTMYRNYDFTFIARGAAYILCCKIVDRIVHLFGISPEDALVRVNEHWAGCVKEDDDIILHETSDYWAAHIVLGNLWWTNPEYASLVADLKGTALPATPSRAADELPRVTNFCGTLRAPGGLGASAAAIAESLHIAPDHISLHRSEHDGLESLRIATSAFTFQALPSADPLTWVIEGYVVGLHLEWFTTFGTIVSALQPVGAAISFSIS